MAEHPPTALSIDQLLQVDRLAEQFENAWRRGQNPGIEPLLGQAPAAVREELLRELVLLEIELRRAAGEAVSIREYRDRFPDAVEWIAPRPATEREASSDVETIEQPMAARPCSSLATLPHGLDLAHYEVLDRVGSGGLGMVYLARKRDRVDEHRVAVKMLKRLDSPEQADRFVAEMTVMARLQHPHIVPILDSGNDRGTAYFVMPYFGQGDLAAALRRHGPLPAQTAVEYVLRVAWAVSYLHEKQILHRDLKPSNILLDEARDARLPFGRPCLTDFGLVKLLESPSNRESPPLLEGTVPYMAPEQAQGRNATLGPACDIWGLGVLLFELLTGQRPFLGKTQSELRDQIVHGEPPSLGTLRNEIPRELQRVVNKCLVKKPDERYASVGQLIDDLDAHLRGEPLTHAPPLGLWERIDRWTRRRPALATRWCVVAVVLVNIWLSRIYQVWNGGPTPPNLIGQLLHQGSYDVYFYANQVILLTWAILSWSYQKLADAHRHERGARLAWLATDAATLTLLLWNTQSADTSLVVAYPVLIAASGLWVDTRGVWLATLLSAIGYLLLVADAIGRGEPPPVYGLLHTLTAFLATGAVVSYQIRRSRALRRLAESRPSQ